LLTLSVSLFIPVTHASLERWVLIVDINGDSLKVNVVYNETWAQLIELLHLFRSGEATWMWIGGTVEAYDNEWGFRFVPSAIFIYQYVAGIFQTSIRLISQNLASWLGMVGYVRAYVVDAYGSPDVNGDGVVNDIDLMFVTLSFGYNGSEPLEPQVDLNYDFRVDVRDLFMVAKHFGET